MTINLSEEDIRLCKEFSETDQIIILNSALLNSRVLLISNVKLKRHLENDDIWYLPSEILLMREMKESLKKSVFLVKKILGARLIGYKFNKPKWGIM